MNAGDVSNLNVSSEEQAALVALLGKEAFATPADLGRAIVWLLERFRIMEEQRKEIATAGHPKYATAKQLAAIFGTSSASIYRFLRPLVATSKVRVWAPTSDTMRGADKRYNIADFERAYLQ